jgi:tetratricopeptide (TPR) repeat protein
MSQSQLQTLLAQKKYRQAIDEIKKLQRSQSDLVLSPTEAEVWRLRGQQELEKSEFKAAENSFRQILKLGVTTEVHYWLAKTLLAENRLDAALELVKSAFESKILPKEECICYLKLLLIKGDFDTVEDLLKSHTKRFSAAQVHWVRGVLELQSGKPKFAMMSFAKVKKPLTPGESMDAWLAYSHQQQGNWDEAAIKLGLFRFSIFGAPKLASHPALKKLAIFQQAAQGQFLPDSIAKEDKATQEIFLALQAIELMAGGNFHDAGHALLQIKTGSTRIAELMALKSTILTMAGEQAMEQGESHCAVQLWQPLVEEKELNPRLVVNCLEALEEEGEYQEQQRLLIRLIKWIESDAKQHPANWPKEKLDRTLAHAHCLIADCLLGLKRARAAVGSVQQALKICPTSGEALGRQGLIAIAEEEMDRGIELLKQALDNGCEFEQVYESLQYALSEENREDEAAEIRKRYGKKFGDLAQAEEVKIEPWIEALATQNYDSFSRLLPKEKSTEPTIRVCQIFKEAAKGKPTSTGKISIDQAQATAAWDSLLAGLSTAAKLSALQTIALSIEVLSKRDKGIAALSSRYMVMIPELISELPTARASHLLVLAVKSNSIDKLDFPVKTYLAAAPQPGNALALLQLQVRWFKQTHVLRSFIDTALAREQQNPLLLLAKATTYSSSSQPYSEFRSQGFELARQVQDAQALAAFRLEDRYLNKNQLQIQDFFTPNLGRSKIDLPPEIEAMFEEMIRKTFGNKVSRAELELIMPMLKQKFIADMLNKPSSIFGDDDDDDEDDFFGFNDDDDDDFIFTPPKKRKRSFMDL